MSTATPLSALARSDGSSTVPQAFDELQDSLQIEDYKPIASKQQKNLRKKLDALLAIVASYLTGSYRRNTQNTPLDDIDLLVILDPEEYAHIRNDWFDGPKAALDLMQGAIDEAYPTSEKVRHSCCIQLKLAGTGIGFDVIPAFQEGDDVFLIPDEHNRTWVRTNPKEHQRLISEANQGVCGQMLVPLVKLLKAANEAMGKPITGFHVEMMAYYALQHAPENARKGVAFLLRDFASRIYGPVPDPWPQGRQVDAYLSWDARLKAADLYKTAAEHAEEAVAAEENDNTEAAHAAWRKVFDKYPVRPQAKAARSLSISAAATAIRNGGRVAATSAGLVAVTPDLASARSATSHGGAVAPHRSHRWSGAQVSTQRHEREIAEVLAQFSALRRLTPAEAAADPTIWPVKEEDVEDLYAVLVGDQFSNLGVKHRLLVLIPKDAPGIEPAIYDLRPFVPARMTPKGWKPKRGLVHRWSGGVLCTSSARDRWDGRLVTLVIWAVEWLFRQDLRQRTGQWIGAEVDGRGRLLVNGRVRARDSRQAKWGLPGRRLTR